MDGKSERRAIRQVSRHIYDLAVAAPHRRRGIATRLIGELTRIASLRDVYVIFVQADLEDSPAIALYESLGTKKTAHHFDIVVPAPGEISTNFLLNRQSKK